MAVIRDCVWRNRLQPCRQRGRVVSRDALPGECVGNAEDAGQSGATLQKTRRLWSPLPGAVMITAKAKGTGMGWTARFEGLQALAPDVARDLQARSTQVRLAAGATVFAPGQEAANLLLLLSGTVRVQQRSDSGREVFLYRVHAGESCVLTTACMLAEVAYSAEALAETDIEAVAIPRAVFDDLAGRSALFRSFVFQAYARRITDLFGLIDDIVFQRMDVRLATRLLDLARDGTVEATHHALAAELGSAREVISRLLGEFQRRGWVSQGRGELRILDADALIRLSRLVT